MDVDSFNKETRLISELYDKVLSCRIIYSDIHDLIPNPSNNNKYDPKRNIIKINFLIQSYVSQVWIVACLLDKQKIMTKLRIKFSTRQKYVKDTIVREIRNHFQHIDERINDYTSGKIENSYIYNILNINGEMIYQFGKDQIKLSELNELVLSCLEPVIKEYHESKCLIMKTHCDPETIDYIVKSGIEDDLSSYK